MTIPWQKRRSEFNHNWLQNQYMPALYKSLNLLDDKIEDPEFEKKFVSSILPAWEERRKEAINLPVDFEEQMSPKSLFSKPPLARCHKKTMEWIPDLTHYLWLVQYPVREWVERASRCAKEADTAYQELQNDLKNCSNTKSAEALRPFRNRISEFISRLNNLSKAISQFPNEVLVV